MPTKKDKKKTTKKRAKQGRKVGEQASQYGNLIKAIGELRGSLMSRNIPIPGSSQFTPYIGYQDQAVSVIRANAANTVARLERELTQKLARENTNILNQQTLRATELQPEPYLDFEGTDTQKMAQARLLSSVQLGTPEQQREAFVELQRTKQKPDTSRAESIQEDTLSKIYQNIYEQTGGKGITKLVKAKKRISKELLETIPEGGLVEAGISMNVPREPLTPFQLIEETRKATPSAFFETPPYKVRKPRKTIQEPIFESLEV